MHLPDPIISSLPSLFRDLLDRHLIQPEQILYTDDRFFMVNKSIASILKDRNILTFPDQEGHILNCGNFFDDWFLYAVPDHASFVCSLLKMREEEFDLAQGLQADGDTPGVTISFISFHTDLLKDCLENPSDANAQKLGTEINRVVAYPKQNHNPALKSYFIRPQAEAPYLIADAYVHQIASFSSGGMLNVPKACKEICSKRTRSAKYARVPDFLDQNNLDANTTVCDHTRIYIRDVNRLTGYEKLAILATHTGNVSVHSFAAEIRYHAQFLTGLLKIRLPFLGSPYASAVRADMSIADKELQGPTPYYNLSGKLVKTQRKHHPLP
jgi:hypothetical protein